MSANLATVFQSQGQPIRGELLDALRGYDTLSAMHLSAGLESHIYLCETRKLGRIVIKVPFARRIDNDNDRHLDSRDLLIQEVTLLKHVRSFGFPAPDVIELVLVDSRTDPDYLILRYVESDAVQVSAHERGRTLRRLHDLPVPNLRCVAQREESLAATIANAIFNRAGVVERFTGRDLHLPTPQAIEGLLTAVQNGAGSLLHMDYRADNLLHRSGAIVAVLDWSNALVGPRELELARVAEYAPLSDEFWTGYGSQELNRLHRPVEILYRLYTATMLAVVFLSEAPDIEKAGKAVDRVRELALGLSAANR